MFKQVIVEIVLFRTVLFYTSEGKKIHVICGCDDGQIYVHNLHASGAKPAMLSGHMSTVTSLVLHNDHTLIRYGRILVSNEFLPFFFCFI